MFRTFLIGAVVAGGAMVALPSEASAQRYRDGYNSRYDGYRDGRRYDGRRYDRRRGDYRNYRRYHRPRSRVNVYYAPSYGYGYAYPGYYGGGYYPGYYGRGYYSSGYYPRRSYGYRCSDGTTGAIVGGAAGALVGREIGRDGGRYGRYGRRGGGSGTTGAIIGGALGALIGREADRGC